MTTISPWRAESEIRVFFVPTGKVTGAGKPKLRRVTVTSIHLLRERGAEIDAIKFTVTRRNGKISIGDRRGRETGVAGTNGAFGTREPESPGGRVEQYSPDAWVREVSRLIGAERARSVLAEVGA